MFISQVELQTSGALDIISIASFIAILLFVWNMSKRFTTLENDNKNGKEQHNKDIEDLKDKINDFDKGLVKQISDAKVERREEINKAVGNNVTRFEVLQKQIDGLHSNLKDVDTRVTTVDTKLDGMDKRQNDLQSVDKELLAFLTTWVQRVEDRIENSRKETCEVRSQFITMITSLFMGNNGK